MSQNYPSVINALGSVVGGTGVANFSAGAASARTATGIYTLTLDEPSDALACACLVTARGTTAFARVDQTSDTVKTVRTFDAAGAALDSDFDFLILRAPLS